MDNSYSIIIIENEFLGFTLATLSLFPITHVSKICSTNISPHLMPIGKKNKSTMMKNVIAYFSITNKPKAIIFDDESITIQVPSPRPLV